VGPGAGLDRCGKSCPTRIRSPDLPALSDSLYRLRYPGSFVCAVSAGSILAFVVPNCTTKRRIFIFVHVGVSSFEER
jgi:hypothetical protein